MRKDVIDDVADIVDGRVVDNPDRAGLTVHFDLRDVRAAREGTRDRHLCDGIERMR